MARDMSYILVVCHRVQKKVFFVDCGVGLNNTFTIKYHF